MDTNLRNQIVEQVATNPLVVGAAVVGSGATGRRVDSHSDLDLLIVTDEVNAFLAQRDWLPKTEAILLFEVHLSRVVSVLWAGMEKLDATIYHSNQGPAEITVVEYRVIKGPDTFSQKLQAAADATRGRSVHFNSDVCIGNILLLLASAYQRSQRGEAIAAHHFLSAACDMTIAYDRRKKGLVLDDDDPIDVSRRVENSRPLLARALNSSLFVEPKAGIPALATYVCTAYEDELTQAEVSVLQQLRNQ